MQCCTRDRTEYRVSVSPIAKILPSRVFATSTGSPPLPIRHFTDPTWRRLPPWTRSSWLALIFNPNERWLCCGGKIRIRARAGTHRNLPRSLSRGMQRSTTMSRLDTMKTTRDVCSSQAQRHDRTGISRASMLSAFICLTGLLAIWWTCLPLSQAQTAASGAISGTVTDPSGAVVEGAKITATNNATGAATTVISSHSGSYLIPLLLPGSYRVEASKQGFKISTYPSITVNVADTEPLNLSLVVGAVDETVQVDTKAEQLQIESSALGH